jgi:hypothetical protein
MNLEILYPELKTMKLTEIFIEWAYVVKGFSVNKIHVKRIIPRKEQNIFIKVLKTEYNINNDPNKFERIELVTIEK